MNDRTTSHSTVVQSGSSIMTVTPRAGAEGTIIVNSAGSQMNSVTMWTTSSEESVTSNPLADARSGGARVYGVVTYPKMAVDGVTFSAR